MDPVLLDRVGESAHDVLLADHLPEALGAVAAVERGGYGHESSLSRRQAPLRMGKRKTPRWTPLDHACLWRLLAHRWRTGPAGVNAKALSVFMGHSNISITLDRYSHLMPGTEAEAATLLDAYLAADRAKAEDAARSAGGEGEALATAR